MPAVVERVKYPTGVDCPLAENTREKHSSRKDLLSSESLLGRNKWIPRGKHLFLAGDPFRHVHLVLHGSLKVYASSVDGEEQVLGFFLPGDALGLESATSQTHRYCAIALEDTSVSELQMNGFQGGLNDTQEQDRQRLLQHLCFETIANNYSALRSRSTKFAEQRLSSFLLDLWDRLDEHARKQGELSLTMSRQDIGDYLGLALGTISRTFAQLEQQMFIRVRCRSVTMLDPDSLRRLACSTQKSSELLFDQSHSNNQ